MSSPSWFCLLHSGFSSLLFFSVVTAKPLGASCRQRVENLANHYRWDGQAVSGLQDQQAPGATSVFLITHLKNSALRVSQSGNGADEVQTVTTPLVKVEFRPNQFKENYRRFYPEVVRPAPLVVTLREDLANISDEILGIQYPLRKEESGFRIGGRNTSPAIKGLKTLNGAPIREVQNNMYPGVPIPDSWEKLKSALEGAVVYGVPSDDGFIETDEKLIDVLVEQNLMVTRRLQMTHQNLIKPLYRITGAFRNGFLQDGSRFLYNGAAFRIEGRSAGQPLYSPFMDGTRSRTYLVVENLSNTEQVVFSTLLPEMIYRYGFYESASVSHHLSPEAIFRLMSSR
jgi:hypothetical protein